MFVLYAVLAVTALFMLSIFAQIDNWQRDWTTNYAKLDAADEDPGLRPLTVDATPEESAAIIAGWVDGQSKWDIVSKESDGDVIDIDLTRTTGLMHYTDDIRVRLHADGGQTRVEAESQSRIGKGDLGQNPRNLKELLDGIRNGTAVNP